MLLALTGCQRIVVNSSDELTLHSWYTELDNGNKISLEFNDNNATVKVSLFDGKTESISGLCEVSDTAFVIHDSNTGVAYPFYYIVHFDRVEIVCGENTVSLYKS